MDDKPNDKAGKNKNSRSGHPLPASAIVSDIASFITLMVIEVMAVIGESRKKKKKNYFLFLFFLFSKNALYYFGQNTLCWRNRVYAMLELNVLFWRLGCFRSGSNTLFERQDFVLSRVEHLTPSLLSLFLWNWPPPHSNIRKMLHLASITVYSDVISIYWLGSNPKNPGR